MKKKVDKRTHIAVLIDRSGSMDTIRQEALDGLNEVLNGIEVDGKLGGETDVTVIQFDHSIDVLMETVPSDMLPRLTLDDYEPRGMTALYDALKVAIDTITDELQTEDTGYLVTVISDGFENASTNMNQESISKLIKELEATGKWTFAFMLANQDIHQFTQRMGVSAGNVAAFTASPTGMNVATHRMGSSNKSYLSTRALGGTNSINTYTPTT